MVSAFFGLTGRICIVPGGSSFVGPNRTYGGLPHRPVGGSDASPKPQPFAMVPKRRMPDENSRYGTGNVVVPTIQSRTVTTLPAVSCRSLTTNATSFQTSPTIPQGRTVLLHRSPPRSPRMLPTRPSGAVLLEHPLLSPQTISRSLCPPHLPLVRHRSITDTGTRPCIRSNTAPWKRRALLWPKSFWKRRSNALHRDKSWPKPSSTRRPGVCYNDVLANEWRSARVNG